MPFIELEGNLFNTEDIVAVRKAEDNEYGFQTELLLVAGQQMLKMPVSAVAQIIAAATAKTCQ